MSLGEMDLKACTPEPCSWCQRGRKGMHWLRHNRQWAVCLGNARIGTVPPF